MLEPERVERLLNHPEVGRVFDGHQFHEAGGGWTVTEALIDAGAGIGGYRENLTEPLLRAARAILRLLTESGIGGLRVGSSSWAEQAHFRALLDQAGTAAPTLTGGGPVLTDSEPASDRQRWITGDAELARALDVAVLEGSGWAVFQTDDPGFAGAGVRAAPARGLRVALRGPVGAASELAENDLFTGVGNLVRRRTADRGLTVLSAWAEAPPDVPLRHAAELAERGVGLTSELLTLHRSVFLREALQAPFLEENVAILPHVRWVMQMRRGTGYVAGRSALREHTGLSEPTRAEAKQAAEGWRRLTEAVGRLHAGGVRILPASTAPQLTLLPGFGLKEELVCLAAAGVPLEELLARATDRSWLALAGRPLLLASDQDPRDPARFLARLSPWTEPSEG